MLWVKLGQAKEPGGAQGSRHLMVSVPAVPTDSVFLPKCLEIEGGKSRNQHMLPLSKSPEVL